MSWPYKCVWTTTTTKYLKEHCEQHTSFIHQRVIIGRPYAFDRSNPERPIKIIGQGAFPATVTVLKGAGSPTILFISAVATVIYEVTALARSETLAIVTRQEAWRTGA